MKSYASFSVPGSVAIRAAVSVVCALFAGDAARALPSLDELVMYEANLRAMSVAGDFAGVIDRLDEIEALGVNTLWLMPIHPVGEARRFGELGSPYSVRDHLAVGSEYGSLDDLRALIDAAHARGISVLLDWVANHTAWDHPWIAAHPGWYTTDAQGNIVHPPGTNWLDVADLDYGVPEMRAAMIDQLVWWVTNTEIDGFRFDAPDFVPYAFWAEAIPAVRAAVPRPLLMFAEGARADHYDAGFDLTFGWRFFYGLRHAFIDGWGAGEIARAHDEESAPVPPGKRVLRWTTNHDETAYDAPPPLLFGSLDASLAAYASMVVYGGAPLIYSGQEVGSTDLTQIVFRDPIDWTTNPDLPAWYAWIIGVRQSHDSIKRGAVTDRSGEDSLVVARTLGDERVAAWINVTGGPVAAPVPPSWASGWTDLGSGEGVRAEGSVALPAHGVRLYRLDAWPTFVVSGALQTEQGDASDWDPAGSSLVFDRVGGVYTVGAYGLADGVVYRFEVVTDAGEPPVGADDPRVATGLRADGDADGAVAITVDDTRTNNTGGPEVWVDTDAAPLQAVGNFMDEAGGAADWDPADASFGMTPLGMGRYVFDTTLSAPGGYAFKASFGAGWGDQIGTDGLNNDARVLGFETAAAGERVRLFVDLRERRLEAWVGACGLDRNGDQRLDLFDVLDLLRGVDAGEAGADFNGDGTVDRRDALSFLEAFASGCG